MANLFSINRKASEGVSVADFKKVTYSDKAKIEKYFSQKIEDHGIGGLYPYSLNYMYNEMTSNNAHRTAVIKKYGDELLVSIKRVDIFSVKFNRLIGLPISKSGNEYNSIRLTEELFDNGTVSELYIPDYDVEFLAKNAEELGLDIEADPADYDFYTETAPRLEYIEKGKYRKKHKINQVAEFMEMRPLTMADYTAVKLVHNAWAMSKENVHGGRLFKYIFNDFIKVVNDENMLFLGLFYKDTLIGFTLCVKMFDKYAFNLMEQTYTSRSFNTEGDELLEKALGHIGQIFGYYTVKYFHNKGLEGFTVAGASGSNKKLLEFKQQLCTGAIKYYKCRRNKDESN